MDVAYPSFRTVLIDGARFDHDVVVEGGTVRSRDKGPSRGDKGRYGHTPLTAGEDIPWSHSTLVIGTGAGGRLPIDQGVWDEAARRGVEVIAVPTAEAAEILRTTDDPDVSAILHVTC